MVGAGIAGIACARRLHDAGVPVRVLERGRRVGGRMAVRHEGLHAADSADPAPDSFVAGSQHAVDLGAPYFTVSEPGFEAVVTGWQDAGLARPWTDAFATAGRNGLTGLSRGPLRWSSTQGMRSLVEALAVGLDIRLGHTVQQVSPAAAGASQVDRKPLVDGESARAVVLAMPDPQAERLLPVELAVRLRVVDRDWAPVVTVWAAWPPEQRRQWPQFDGVFVAASPVVSWVADSGRSRDDGAPVLVVHTTPEFACAYLDDPAAAIEPVLAELALVLGHELGHGHGHAAGVLPEPLWARAHRWSLARTRDPHAEPWVFEAASAIGVCGDAWGPRSRVEQAWLSGTGLAEALLEGWR